MWPQALEMSRDECRGALRRLELESYAQVVNVFRAQGSLDENKAKLLDELRGIFHISQERHRAEARRVANDERLSTIAETLAGPNTWQEWSREGRRCLPMLPRVAPQTALAILANKVAAETTAENTQLPYPEETGIIVKEEQKEWGVKRNAFLENFGGYKTAPVVHEDPFKIPEVPAVQKKTSKRASGNESHKKASNKKRSAINEGSAIVSSTKSFTHQQQQRHHSPTLISYDAIGNFTGKHQQQVNQQQQQLEEQNQQQNFFDIQQTSSAKKMKTLQPKRIVARRQTICATPAKLGRKSAAQKLQQQQSQQLSAIDPALRHILPPSAAQHQGSLIKSNFGVVNNFNGGGGSLDFLQYHGGATLSGAGVGNMSTHATDDATQAAAQALATLPQIAASKKDITKNIHKLQIPHGTLTATTTTTAGNRITIVGQQNPIVISPAKSQTTQSAAAVAAATGMLSLANIHTNSKQDKSLISTTPVQKYIVEDRGQMGATSAMIGSSTGSTTGLTSSQVQQHCITMPQAVGQTLSGNRVRTINAANILTGSGINNAKKLLPTGTVLTQEHVLVDNQQALSPSHGPPAVMQLTTTGDGNAAEQSQYHATPTQSKVLTTKLMPVVIQGPSSTGSGNAGGVMVSGSGLTVNNGTTMVAAAGGSGSGNSSSLGTVSISLSSGSIIRTGPPTVIFSAATSSTTSGLFSTQGSTLLRKPNILKSIISTTKNSPPNATTGISSPQILSHIRLLPHNLATGGSGSPNQLSSPQFVQRANLKISPNGKVFVQSTNAAAALAAKIQSGSLQPRFGLAGAASHNAATTNKPKVAIQKVQIIPAPTQGGVINTTTNLAQQLTAASFKSHGISTLNNMAITGGKGNMLIMPSNLSKQTTGAGIVSGKLLLPKGNLTIASNGRGKGSSGTGNIVKSTTSVEISKPNVVIIGAVSNLQASSEKTLGLLSAQSQTKNSTTGSQTHTTAATTTINTITPTTIAKSINSFMNSNKTLNSNYSVSSTSIQKGFNQTLDHGNGNTPTTTNQMITEDTPIDILNLPIIVDDGCNVVEGVGSTTTPSSGNVTLLQGSTFMDATTDFRISGATTIVTNSQQQQQHLQEQTQNAQSQSASAPSTIILGATDWEMELDQATSNRQTATIMPQQSNNNAKLKDQHDNSHNTTIIFDNSFDDVIVEEQDEEHGVNTTTTTTTTITHPATDVDDIIMMDADNGNHMLPMASQISEVATVPAPSAATTTTVVQSTKSAPIEILGNVVLQPARLKPATSENISTVEDQRATIIFDENIASEVMTDDYLVEDGMGGLSDCKKELQSTTTKTTTTIHNKIPELLEEVKNRNKINFTNQADDAKKSYQQQRSPILAANLMQESSGTIRIEKQSITASATESEFDKCFTIRTTTSATATATVTTATSTTTNTNDDIDEDDDNFDPEADINKYFNMTPQSSDAISTTDGGNSSQDEQ